MQWPYKSGRKKRKWYGKRCQICFKNLDNDKLISAIDLTFRLVWSLLYRKHAQKEKERIDCDKQGVIQEYSLRGGESNFSANSDS